MIENQNKYNQINTRGSVRRIYLFNWEDKDINEPLNYDYLGKIEQLNGGYKVDTKGYEIDVSITAKQIRIDNQSNNDFFDLSRRKLISIIEDEESNLWFFGLESGLDCKVEVDSGKEKSEFSGYSFDISGKQEEFPFLYISGLYNLVFFSLLEKWQSENQTIESEDCLNKIINL